MTEITYNDAMTDVRARVKKAKTSFASGMAVLPLPRREAMYALYAFCREVDDIADDSPTDEIREEGLSLWREQLDKLFKEGAATDTITRALLPAIKMFHLVEEDFLSIIEGMEMDAREKIVAPPLEKLDTYCDHVASAVGRISVRIFGDSREGAMKVAYHLGRALQLTNILRDLAEDAARGRCYLPEEYLAKHGIETRDPAAILKHPALPEACQDLAALAEGHFDKTNEALKKANWNAMRPARAMRNYYHAILKLLLKKNWQEPEKRVSLPFCTKFVVALRGLLN